jgi:2'-hydroxyisoflavone reductase
MPTRRSFITTSAAAGLVLGLGGCRPGPEDGGEPGSPPARPLRILFLGGTGFLGPPTVEYALGRGHTVTLFNRGQTNTDLFPEVEKLVGDRAASELSALAGQEWDAVIDTSANDAAWVQDSAALLEGSVDRYLFVSSISAHTDHSAFGQTEDAPVFSRAQYESAVAEGRDWRAAFGENKAQAERITWETFGDQGLVVRPGLIVGPGDRSDRFTYWPVRIDRGGEVLAPGDGSDRSQIVDVRDLGAFLVDLIEARSSGTFNATGPAEPMTMRQMLEGIRDAVSSDARLTWVAPDFLREHEVGAWIEMPVWFYPDSEMAGLSSYDCSKAIAAGLGFRPLADTARDTLAWWKTGPGTERSLQTGLEPEKEAALLAAWHAREA